MMTEIPGLYTLAPKQPLPALPSLQRKVTPFYKGRTMLPPGLNRSYTIGHFNDFERLVSSPELKQFKRDAALELTNGEHDWPVIYAIRTAQITRIRPPLAADLHFFFPSLWKRDADGGEKHGLDAACEHLQINDNLFVDIHITKQVSVEDPHLEIELYCFV